MNKITKVALAIVVIAMLLGLIYIQLEIQSIISYIQPKEIKPTATPTTTPSPNPTPYVPPASVISNLSFEISHTERTDIIFVNGTVTNNSTNTAFDVGLLVTAHSTSTYYPYLYSLGVTVPLVSGNYYDYGGATVSANATHIRNLTTLFPNQTVTVSIAVHPDGGKILQDPQVTPVWSNMP